MIAENIKIQIASLPQYDRTIAEIYLNDVFMGLISEEKKGVFKYENETGIEVPVEKFIYAINAAIDRLQSIS